MAKYEIIEDIMNEINNNICELDRNVIDKLKVKLNLFFSYDKDIKELKYLIKWNINLSGRTLQRLYDNIKQVEREKNDVKNEIVNIMLR